MMSILTLCYPGDRGLEFLLSVILQVTLVSTAAWLISWRLAGKAALRHLVLFSALVWCLASPAVTGLCAAAGWSLVSVSVLPAGQLETVDESPRTEAQEVSMPRPAELSRDAAPLPPRRANAMVDRNEHPITGSATETPRATPSPSKSPHRPADPVVSSFSFRAAATTVMLVWLAGTLLMLVRLARNARHVVELRRSSRVSDSDRIRALLQEVVSQLGARRHPVTLISSRMVVPLAVGFGRPALILPERLLAALDDNQLRAVLLHEVAHLERGDHRIVLLEGLAGALYWPLVSVHGLNRELARAREEVCDNVVLRSCDAVGYGKTLLHIAQLLLNVRPLRAAVGVVGRQGELERRIRGLIDPRRNTMTRTGRKMMCVVTSIFLAAGVVGSSIRLTSSAVAQENQAQAVTESSERGQTEKGQTEKGQTEKGQTEKGQTEKGQTEAAAERQIILHGKILGPQDRSIPGARLYVSLDEWTDPVELGTSDATGSYRFSVPETKLRRTVAPGFAHADCQASLIATAEGFGSGWAELPAVGGGRIGQMQPEYAHDLHLAPDFPIAGRIVDVEGKPVARAVVKVSAIFELAGRRWYKMPAAIEARDPDLMNRQETDSNNWFARLYPTAWRMLRPGTTDAEGRFRITGVGGNRVIRLHVDGPGVWSTYVSAITRDDADEFTQMVRAKYPRTPDPNGYFYPPRKDVAQAEPGVLLFGPSPTIEVDPARTVSGVVRDATSGEPIADVQVATADAFGAGQASTDRDGRYRILRAEDDGSVLLYTRTVPERYLTVVHQLTHAKGFGEIVSDFDLPPGVMIDGRVVESGTDRPIVSSPRQGCHDTEPGPLVAGYVYYFPLATNSALRGSPTGLYFEGFPRGTMNYYTTAVIGGDGRFRLAVPPGPGVLFVQSSPGMPMFAEFSIWKESEGMHRLFPYVKLVARDKDDGAPAGDPNNLPGFVGPIPLANYNAYRVIDPSADATTLDVTLNVARAPSRTLHFMGPDGKPSKGLMVKGLVSFGMQIVLDGSDAEVLALEPGTPREVIAATADGKYAAKTSVSTDGPASMTVQLERAEIVFPGLDALPIMLPFDRKPAAKAD